MNTNNFLFEPAKQTSDLSLRGHILSFPTLLPFNQMPLELLSLRKTPVLFLTIVHWHLDTVFSHLLPPMTDSLMTYPRWFGVCATVRVELSTRPLQVTPLLHLEGAIKSSQKVPK